MAQKIFTSFIPFTCWQLHRYPVWTAAFLSSAELSMLQRAATKVPPYICDHMSLHTLFRVHMVSPQSNSNLMWKNCLCVFVFSLLSYLEGRPAVPLRLPENRVSLTTGSPQGMWFEGYDDRAAFLPWNICTLCLAGARNPNIRHSFHWSSRCLCSQELHLKMHPLAGRSNTFNICQLPLTQDWSASYVNDQQSPQW